MPDMSLPWMLAATASAIGALMGLMSLAVPRWGANVVRLAPAPDMKGGWAEFRSSYGGALVLAHGAVLLTLSMSGQAGSGAVMGASFAVGLYWLGMAIGRAISMAADADRGTRTRYNAAAIGFETLLGLALCAPFIAHLGG
ncbi:MAG TPA: hypothetical protein DF715_16685 [Oceanicaulis sp.]|jgi:hypothetical protein|uniref:DUF4345 domain-containing protein n=1 Tax=Glycocaulis albus TaxID=1382801 RepID=A0ABQ1XTU4_9PROT|nr:hypothetical protein [Glycocaulis albus]MBV5258779.1 hypothetical protein [Synechococcus moorigangaii CMS01]GGH02677.1 hypothetical protein GCM10007420_18710 [Glycocaulis albus]HCY57067.1 hypothetical protein [Oceanicaulis sp.]